MAFRPLGESNNVNEVWCEFRLAVNVVRPGGCGRISAVLAWMRWRCGLSRQAVSSIVSSFEALGA
ncbi:hypothetical protein DEO72_LG10g2037 [Vigna unguiculata]|uniref:Uncharacterized protein n=1 Tax=Vigna unguiculata TaxID=3917 RepID=A0A4D6NF50_VIGUN|nr:hypothetical protein DEO72_LG10g2037 [Vigna unguiculata]